VNYATLTQVRQYLQLGQDEMADDSLLNLFIRLSHRAIDERMGVKFDPHIATRRFDVPAYDWLHVGNDLLVVNTLTNGDSTVIDFANFFVEPYDEYPKRAIILKPNSSLYWRPTNGEYRRVIQVAGIWGYHDDYANIAWVDSQDEVEDAAGVDASVTAVTVGDADGEAEDLDIPRFQAGQLIRVESEYMDVQAVNTTTNILTVKRGANGSTAAAHAKDMPIDIWRPMDNIVMATLRLAVWRYRQKDVNSFDRTTILGTGIAIIPAAMPADVVTLLPVIGGTTLG
jgi:hypothetical protein